MEHGGEKMDSLKLLEKIDEKMKEFWEKARSDVSATAHNLVDQMRLEDSS